MSDLLAKARRVPGLELELRTDTQFADAYLDGAPFAHLRRRRIIGEADAPVWSIYLKESCGLWYGAASASGAVRVVEAEASGQLRRRQGVTISQPAFAEAEAVWSQALAIAYGLPGSIAYSRARYELGPKDWPAAVTVAWRQRERARIAWDHDAQAALAAVRAAL